jgi:glyoxylase-like metal-dependent hydrolase (beta-lactamase superfamily II)
LLLCLLAPACAGPGPQGAVSPDASAQVATCDLSETLSLSPGVYSFRHGLYSTLFVTGLGAPGVIAFDPLGSESVCLGQAIRAAAPGQMVEHIIYSHGHFDHIAGAANLPLSPSVRVYAHQQAVLDIERQGPDPAVLRCRCRFWAGASTCIISAPPYRAAT